MLDPEILERAEANGYYTFTVQVPNELEISKQTQRKVVPNGYSILQEYAEKFSQSHNVISPIEHVLSEEVVPNAHQPHSDPEQSGYNVYMEICCEGGLQIDDVNGETKVVEGQLDIIVHFSAIK